ncbi:MAG: efflux RND transporter periplasmic adaptor subunit [Candidatus Aminicenantes bacterium]|nr:efflux RND transporter periplasmic adaptor subunit [Candidatus Aminicenantes bacterium]
MKNKLILLLAVIVLVSAFVVFLVKRPSSEYYTLQRTDVDYKILASCTVSFPEPYAMAAKSEGDVKIIAVAEGQQVTLGALLIQVDDFKERQNLTIAQNNYENTRLKLVNAKEETYPRLKEQLNDTGSVLADAKKQAERMQALYAGGAVSKVEFENAKTKLDTAQARFNQAKLQLDSYARSGAAAELINQLNILNAQVELAKRAVHEKQFVAPYDCTIIKINVKEGETVTVGKTAVIILEKKPWVLETNVDQKELGFLETDLPCLVVFDAYPSEKVRAVISLVCSTIDQAKGTCNLKLQIKENRAFIKHGMTGSVEISGKKVRGVNVQVLALPSQFIIRESDANYVLVDRDSKIEKIRVEFSPIGENWVSISNIPDGTRIVLPNEDRPISSTRTGER